MGILKHGYVDWPSEEGRETKWERRAKKRFLRHHALVCKCMSGEGDERDVKGEGEEDVDVKWVEVDLLGQESHSVIGLA